MLTLYNDDAYPIVSLTRKIVPELRNPWVRAVAYRNESIARSFARVRRGINAPDVPAIADRYDLRHGTERSRSGSILFLRNFMPGDVSGEAEKAGIELTSSVLWPLTRGLNRLRGIFTNAYRGYTGDMTSPIGGHVLFTPKGGVGRAPELHTDFLSLAGHCAIALSTIKLYMKEPDQRTWDALNRAKTALLSPEDRALAFQYLVDLVRQNPADFASTFMDDFMITKGQRDRDLDEEIHRQQVCVHSSSPDVADFGQVAALFFPRAPK